MTNVTWCTDQSLGSSKVLLNWQTNFLSVALFFKEAPSNGGKMPKNMPKELNEFSPSPARHGTQFYTSTARFEWAGRSTPTPGLPSNKQHVTPQYHRPLTPAALHLQSTQRHMYRWPAEAGKKVDEAPSAPHIYMSSAPWSLGPTLRQWPKKPEEAGK